MSSGGVVTRRSREEGWMLRELREPWALVARRAGHLAACGEWARARELSYVARLLAACAAHESIDRAAWRESTPIYAAIPVRSLP